MYAIYALVDIQMPHMFLEKKMKRNNSPIRTEWGFNGPVQHHCDITTGLRCKLQTWRWLEWFGGNLQVAFWSETFKVILTTKCGCCFSTFTFETYLQELKCAWFGLSRQSVGDKGTWCMFYCFGNSPSAWINTVAVWNKCVIWGNS